MEDTISRKEHEEFVKRIDAENERQNKRIELLETSVRQISELTSSVKELAINMNYMLAEQEKQGKHLEAIENRDGERWRSIVSYVITLPVGAIFAFILAKFGL